jgi:hypothetical protein
MSRHFSYVVILNLIGLAPLATDSPLWSSPPATKGINATCAGEWAWHKELIMDKRDSLYNALTGREKSQRCNDRCGREITLLKDRLAGLDKIIRIIHMLEKSDDEYILRSAHKAEGSLSYDTHKKCIVLTVGSTANFIHEITHAAQYEAGEIIFDAALDKSYLQDLYDEVEAYQAQFAYDPASVAALMAGSVARSPEQITTQWVAGLQSSDGEKTYQEHSRIRVNIHSKKATLLQAYPQFENQFRSWADNWTMKEAPGIIYKKQSLVFRDYLGYSHVPR